MKDDIAEGKSNTIENDPTSSNGMKNHKEFSRFFNQDSPNTKVTSLTNPKSSSFGGVVNDKSLSPEEEVNSFCLQGKKPFFLKKPFL